MAGPEAGASMRPELQLLADAAAAVRLRTALGEHTGYTWAAQMSPRPHGEISGTIRAMPGACFTVDEVIDALPPGPTVDRTDVFKLCLRMRQRGDLEVIGGEGITKVWKLTETGRVLRKQGRVTCPT